MLLIDNREKKPSATERSNELKSLGIECKIEYLECGDYMWFHDKIYVVERKTIADLISSVDDGRLTHFIECAAEMDAQATLLVEGTEIPFFHGGRRWSLEGIDNLLLSVQQVGVSVARSLDFTATSRRLKSLYDYTGKEHKSLTAIQVHQPEKPYFDPNKKKAVRFIMGLPGWGEKRASDALEVYANPNAVLDAIRDDNVGVKGVGPGSIKAAKEFLWRTV